MSEREKLIELIDDFGDDVSLCDVCSRPREDCEGCTNEQLAEYLLKNGVVVLPCGMDNVRKLNVYYKHHIKNKYAIVRYDCQRGRPYKIVSYDIQGKELLQNEDIKLYGYLPSTNFTVILDGFDTKAEAEKALKGGAEQ